MKILVTGAKGFIGKNLIEELKRQMKHDFYKAVGLGIDYGA